MLRIVLLSQISRILYLNVLNALEAMDRLLTAFPIVKGINHCYILQFIFLDVLLLLHSIHAIKGWSRFLTTLRLSAVIIFLITRWFIEQIVVEI